MKKMTYGRAVGPSNPSDVSNFETEFDVRLPDDYKHFLTTIGGGYAPEPCFADVPTWPPGVVLTYVFCMAPADTLDLKRHQNMVSMYIPACLLSFAEDPSGQFFVIDLRPEPDHYGKIYVRDHDHAMNENPFLSAEFFEQYDCDPDERFLYHYIAGSFTEFLDMLYSDDDS